MAEKAVIVSFLLMMFMLFGLTMAKTYVVGDSAGWTSNKQVDYKRWSVSKHFEIGDVLLFEFNPNKDNIVLVTKKDFEACNGYPFGTPSLGKERFPLDSEGQLYFICSVPGHCKAGQKLEITVHSAASPAMAPTPSTTNKLSPSDSASNGSLLLSSSFCFSFVLPAFSLYLVA
ncbi:mavicyanin-like [Lycium ferocissimum]|uniref:mavicyanin-like n=1 Tax=Lycium ferocissimum TaxID=112874 RepID=UPI002815A41E|nr:mavicyanin-like [Lycium ferocissimum]